jgi:hypothetical protein
VVIMEAYCDIFGEPRVDPAQIESAGVVIRRIGEGGTRQAWIRRDGKVAGWISLTSPEELNRDPNPVHRDGPSGPGPAEVRRELLRRMGTSSRDEETVTSLFVAPPETCTAASRTVLYGLLQVASGEMPDGSVNLTSGYKADEVQRLIAPYFTSGKPPDWTGLQGLTVSHDDVAKRKLSPNVLDRLSLFMDLLRGMIAVFDAFQSAELMKALNQVQLDYGEGVKQPAGKALAHAAEILIQAKAGTVTLPQSWPTVSAQDAAQILKAALATTTPRMKQIVPPERRFERNGASYVARAFVRIRREDGCAPAVVWSRESEPFTIAAWHEAGKLPPVMISLPSPKNFAAFKPNVAFKVPEGLFNLLGKNSSKDFLEGNAKPADDTGLGLGWICGFNIPIITLCAFIVLSIFLSLLNIIFFWLPFIKICIPIPRSLSERFKT